MPRKLNISPKWINTNTVTGISSVNKKRHKNISKKINTKRSEKVLVLESFERKKPRKEDFDGIMTRGLALQCCVKDVWNVDRRIYWKSKISIECWREIEKYLQNGGQIFSFANLSVLWLVFLVAVFSNHYSNNQAIQMKDFKTNIANNRLNKKHGQIIVKRRSSVKRIRVEIARRKLGFSNEI